MVQCIPVIQELLNKCQAEETELEGKGDSSLVLKRKCRADALDPLIIEKWNAYYLKSYIKYNLN